VYQLDCPNVILLLLILCGRRRDVDDLVSPLSHGKTCHESAGRWKQKLALLTFEVVVLREATAIGASCLDNQ
jgi:hypothetical protein